MFVQTEPTKLLFGVEDLDPLDRAGLLPDDMRVELVEGELIVSPPPEKDHLRLVVYLHDFFRTHIRDTHQWLNEWPIALPDRRSVRVADMAVFPRRDFDYEHGFPPVDVIELAIEVSVTSQRRDLLWKRSAYARAGIPHYWVIGVARRIVHVFGDPVAGEYRRSEVFEAGDTITDVPGTDGASLIIADLPWPREGQGTDD